MKLFSRISSRFHGTRFDIKICLCFIHYIIGRYVNFNRNWNLVHLSQWNKSWKPNYGYSFGILIYNCTTHLINDIYYTKKANIFCTKHFYILLLLSTIDILQNYFDGRLPYTAPSWNTVNNVLHLLSFLLWWTFYRKKTRLGTVQKVVQKKKVQLWPKYKTLPRI